MKAGWQYSNYGARTRGEFYIFEDGFFALSSDGENIWGPADDCTFGFIRVTLDPNNPRAEIIAYFDVWAEPGFVGVNSSHMGLMIRGADTAEAQNVAFRIYQTGGLRYTARLTDGGESTWQAPANIMAPLFMRIVREGDVFNAYFKELEGEAWRFGGTYTIPMSNTILIGVVGYAQNQSASGVPLWAGMFGNLEVRTGDEVGTVVVDTLVVDRGAVGN